MSRVVLVVYLNWVNSVVYQVPIAYVTPLTLAVNSLGCLCQLIFTLDAYRIKNHVQIFMQCVANICLSISTVLQYGEIRDAAARILLDHDTYGTPFADHDWPFWKKASVSLMVCAVVTCGCSAIMCGLAMGLYREFSWALYQHVSPDRKMQRKYFVYQVSISNTAQVLLLPGCTHKNTDLSCSSQDHTLLCLRIHIYIRPHRCSLHRTRVLFDPFNTSGYSYTCGYRSILRKTRAPDRNGVCFGESFNLYRLPLPNIPSHSFSMSQTPYT
jgi:hypothetical protein